MKRALIPHPSNPLWMLVPLANGKGFAVIDVQDAEEVGRYNWCISRVYALTRIDRASLLLHRLVAERAGLDTSLEIDHVNGDGLDCRRSNLRPATHAQNLCNRRQQSNNTSGVKGVSWNRRAGKWQAGIKVNGRGIGLGYFNDIADAEAAVKAARLHYHGEFANHGVPANDNNQAAQKVN